MVKDVGVGIIGYGTIGMGTAQVLQENADLIARRTGRTIKLKKIADLDIETKREYQVDTALLTTNVDEIINDPEISIVVESIGGTEPARSFILKSIRAGKYVVTPNKEVIAKHGPEIFSEARKCGVDVYFEGAVGGGIPIIRPLNMCLAANNILEIYGIVNGTTNYILTKMADEGKDFAGTLAEAQALGYAEADPTSDIDGFDSAYKLVILSSIAFGTTVKFEDIHFEGIRSISAADNVYAEEFGYVIKLLAIGKKSGEGIEVRVHPTMMHETHPLAKIKGVNNAIYVKGDFVGETMFYGPGAGSKPTASALAADIMDIVHGMDLPVGSRNLRPYLEDISVTSIGDIWSEYYLRLEVIDEPGVLAAIAGIFSDHNVSIKSALQKDLVDGGAELVIITHEVQEKNLQNALERIKGLATVQSVPSLIRVGI